MSDDKRVLLKLRASSRLAASPDRWNLRPLFERRPSGARFGLDASATWYVADLTDGGDEGETAWDLAHSRIASRLGLAESDVLFAEPDLVHDVFLDPSEPAPGEELAVGEDCSDSPQDGTRGKAVGPDRFGWHLDAKYSELARAREEVPFTPRRTRIAHVDTGYSPRHETVPEHILRHLERNFVDPDQPDSAVDPDNDVFGLDNSGHGTGTLGILAGGRASGYGGAYLGGAPAADIVPIRVADRVVLLRTSALAKAFEHAASVGCEVMTLSMGGLPSRAWAETSYAAYLSGVCIVAAAGNNVSGLPTRHIVYPARYRYVVAVCGVMANGDPYHDLKRTALEGNYGPDSRMESALTAYTPNIPWPRYGCDSAVRLDGEGTSAATPQVAAAAALWIEKNKHELPRDWRRVEAVRNALFSSAKWKTKDPKRFGNGVVRARKALSVRPFLGLPKAEPESDWLAFLRVVTGLGVVDAPARERMMNLELQQLWMRNRDLQKLVPDLDTASPLEDADLRDFMEAVIEEPRASASLRKHVAERYPVITGARLPKRRKTRERLDAEPAAFSGDVEVASPPHRRVRVYAVDPSRSTRLETAATNEVVLKVRWEKDLEPGPKGEYLDVVDKDPTGVTYAAVDLDDPRLLAQDGWAPSEGNPQFHQQMVYAVAMKTIEHFESALGRPVLWRPRPNPAKPFDDSRYVGRLAVHPHAMWRANAFYSPAEVALEFGYFEAQDDDPRAGALEGRVYSCLSHDIIAHETTHAILDGMHRRFNEPSNPDVLALHEGFADIVALMQHFTLSEVLRHEIGRTRGDLEAESILGSLAVQFGRATGRRGALRNAIGRVENGRWRRLEPDPKALEHSLAPHARGAILVAAVFDAFIAIHKVRTADLLRIYTGGTGVLPAGRLHPDLVGRLADEAAKAASHVLNICIRALDYLPPVDVTFGEYLRALITADVDLVRDDRYHYRIAFVDAFRGRGISPRGLATLAVDTLVWDSLDVGALPAPERRRAEAEYVKVLAGLKSYADECLYLEDREELFHRTRKQRKELHEELGRAFKKVPGLMRILGLEPGRGFEVHELRRAMRVGPDGRHIPQLVVQLTQSRTVEAGDDTPAHEFRGGTTLVVDLSRNQVQYAILKRIDSEPRMARTRAFLSEAKSDPLKALLFAPGPREPFAMLHSISDDG